MDVLTIALCTVVLSLACMGTMKCVYTCCREECVCLYHYHRANRVRSFNRANTTIILLPLDELMSENHVVIQVSKNHIVPLDDCTREKLDKDYCCPICLDQLVNDKDDKDQLINDDKDDKGQVVMIDVCKHVFCSACINQWTNYNKGRLSSCPLCLVCLS